MGQPLSVNQLSALTGKDRRTIAARLTGLACTAGAKGAHLYDSAAALAAIYTPDTEGKTLDQARTELAIEQARTARVRGDEIERTRIPLHVVSDIWDAALQSAAATLKASRGKSLNQARINLILEPLRTAKLPLTW